MPPGENLGEIRQELLFALNDIDAALLELDVSFPLACDATLSLALNTSTEAHLLTVW